MEFDAFSIDRVFEVDFFVFHIRTVVGVGAAPWARHVSLKEAKVVCSSVKGESTNVPRY